MKTAYNRLLLYSLAVVACGSGWSGDGDRKKLESRIDRLLAN